jgi:prolipoprotein diacylglyceryl transferase
VSAAADQSAGIVFDADPIILDLGRLELSWYGLFFGAMFWFGFFLFYRYIRRGGYSIELAKNYLPWLFVCLVVGARLGHVLFYEPGRFLDDPLEIVRIWKGGLSSHGATLGILFGLYVYCRYHGLRYVDLVDRMCMPAAVAAALVRLGNLMNSEIVGARTDVPWGFKFVRHDCKTLDLCHLLEADDYLAEPGWARLVEQTPLRHPTQLYEFLIGAAVLALMWVLDRRFGGERRPLGLLTGAFGMAYFGLRFFVEFVKERQALGEEALLTMGQYMSIPIFAFGVYLTVRALRRRESADSLTIPERFADRG